jgi:polyferredoxin
VATRAPLIVELLRDRNALYRIAPDGSIENGYTLKLVNKSDRAQRYRVRIESAAPLTLREGEVLLDAAPESVLNRALTLRAAPGAVVGRESLRLVVEALEPPHTRAALDAAFFGPVP